MAIRTPRPVRPRLKIANAYEADLKDGYFNPFRLAIEERLAKAAAMSQAIRLLNEGVSTFVARPMNGIPVDRIQHHLNVMETYNRTEMIKTFQSALGVDIRPFLAQPVVAEYINEKIADNVSLIKTIPTRFNNRLTRRIQETFADKPFDEYALKQVVAKEFKSSGYNLRRICRDQTSKVNGQLTAMRHKQVGVKEFVWSTAGDARVRDEHVLRDGVKYNYGAPPDGELPGEPIQCRCVAIPVVAKPKPRRGRRLGRRIGKYLGGKFVQEGVKALFQDEVIQDLLGLKTLKTSLDDLPASILGKGFIRNTDNPNTIRINREIPFTDYEDAFFGANNFVDVLDLPEAAADYFGSKAISGDINYGLIAGSLKALNRNLDRIKALDSNMARTDVGRTVYRGMPRPDEEFTDALEAWDRLLRLQKGDVLDNAAYTSTTFEPGIALSHLDRSKANILMEIDVPKNTRSMVVGTEGLSGEMEMFLGRGHRLMLQDVIDTLQFPVETGSSYQIQRYMKFVLIPDPPPRPKLEAPKTFEELDKVRTSRSTDENAWHKGAWTDTESYAAQAAAKTDPIDSVFASEVYGAYYDDAKRVISVSSYGRDYQGFYVWRHEFGHHIDFELGNVRKRPESRNDYGKYLASSEQAFVEARELDVARMVRSLHDSYNLTERALQFAELSKAKRLAELKAISERLGASLKEFKSYLKTDGFMHTTEWKTFPAKYTDALIYRFLIGLEAGDVQGALDALGFKITKPSIARIGIAMVEDVESFEFKVLHRKGMSGYSMMSDTADALSVGKVSGPYHHLDSYYRDKEWLRYTEAFANTISVNGAGKIPNLVYARMFPEFHSQVIRVLREQHDIEKATTLPARQPVPSRVVVPKSQIDRLEDEIYWDKQHIDDLLETTPADSPDIIRLQASLAKKIEELEELKRVSEETFYDDMWKVISGEGPRKLEAPKMESKIFPIDEERSNEYASSFRYLVPFKNDQGDRLFDLNLYGNIGRGAGYETGTFNFGIDVNMDDRLTPRRNIFGIFNNVFHYMKKFLSHYEPDVVIITATSASRHRIYQKGIDDLITPETGYVSIHNNESSLTNVLLKKELLYKQDEVLKDFGFTGRALNVQRLLEEYAEGQRDFVAARIVDSDFEGLNLPYIDLSATTLRGASFRESNLEVATITNADFTRTNFRDSNLREAVLQETVFREADFRGAVVTYADFSFSDLSYANFEGVDLRKAHLNGVNLTGANLRDTDLRGTNLTNANLTGADLTDALVDDIDTLIAQNVNLNEVVGYSPRLEAPRPKGEILKKGFVEVDTPDVEYLDKFIIVNDEFVFDQPLLEQFRKENFFIPRDILPIGLRDYLEKPSVANDVNYGLVTGRLEYKDVIKDIDKSMRLTQEEFTVYRNVIYPKELGSQLEYEQLFSTLVLAQKGEEILFPGFTSTSMDPSVVFRVFMDMIEGQNLLMEIDVPAGTRVVGMENYMEMTEVLIGRGYKFVVEDIRDYTYLGVTTEEEELGGILLGYEDYPFVSIPYYIKLRVVPDEPPPRLEAPRFFDDEVAPELERLDLKNYAKSRILTDEAKNPSKAIEDATGIKDVGTYNPD